MPEVTIEAFVLGEHVEECPECGFDSLVVALVAINLNGVPYDLREGRHCGRCG